MSTWSTFDPWNAALLVTYVAGVAAIFAYKEFRIRRLIREAHAMMTEALRDVARERDRQVAAEGWTTEHDDEHDGGELAAAAASYAIAAADQLHPLSQGDGSFHADNPPVAWPWGASWWKPTDPRRNLVKAAALILAEIERLDRMKKTDVQATAPEKS